ncbi:hypothetical protein RUND412_003723 [Rhizina undulata]
MPSSETHKNSEKDIEANGGIPGTRGSSSSDLSSDYIEGIVRVTSLEDFEKSGVIGDSVSGMRTVTRSSRASTRTTKDLEAVLNTEFEVKWKPNDPDNPRNWSLLKKGLILSLVSFQTLMVVFYSTSYISGSEGMMKEFGIGSQTTITLGMTMYMLGLATGPLILAPMSELYGRRPVYLITLFLFFILVLPACLAPNFPTIMVVRFLGAVVGSVTISNAPGTLGDIFDEDQRTLAFSCFCLAPMNGPVLGPIIGGFVYQNLGWRWTNWLVFIFGAIFWFLGIFCPETYAPVLLRKHAEKLRNETSDERYMSRFCYKDGEGDWWLLIKTNMQRPFVMLFTEPICMFWAIYIAVIYGILYLCFTAYPVVFSEIRHWSPGISGLAFCGIGAGTLIAICLDPVNRKVYNMHKIDPETGKRPPEARIAGVCVAAVLTPAATLWFAWTCYPTSIHWIWPILSGIPYGLGNTLIFLHGNNYLVTSYDIYAASALAGNAVSRSIIGAIMPLFGPQMYHKLGPNWAATTVGLIATALIPIPWGFYKWGKKVRVRSPILQRLQKEKAERGE